MYIWGVNSTQNHARSSFLTLLEWSDQFLCHLRANFQTFRMSEFTATTPNFAWISTFGPNMHMRGQFNSKSCKELIFDIFSDILSIFSRSEFTAMTPNFARISNFGPNMHMRGQSYLKSCKELIFDMFREIRSVSIPF